MGSPASEPGRLDNEGPQHQVTIGKPFAVGKFHVTRDQFSAFVSETGYKAGSTCMTFDNGVFRAMPDRSWRNPGYQQTGSHPVACVSWNDARAYVTWLKKKTGKNYRLLSESEWEYAAREQTSPGTYPRYFFGDDEKDLCRFGNSAVKRPSSKFRSWPGRRFLAPTDTLIRRRSAVSSRMHLVFTTCMGICGN
jgi:formylglycine-generating enzyme required for sulfatase activity